MKSLPVIQFSIVHTVYSAFKQALSMKRELYKFGIIIIYGYVAEVENGE